MSGARGTVLIVIGQLDLGGTEKHLAAVLPRLAANGFEVAVFALKDGGAVSTMLQQAGVEIHAHRTRQGGVLGLVRAAWHLARVVRRMKPTVVHFFLPAAYVVGLLPSFAHPRAARVMSRRSLSHYQAAYPGLRWLERRFHRALTAALGNSKAVVQELRREGVPDERLGLIYNGVAPRAAAQASRARARRALDVPEQRFVILSVANLIPYKGHADLIDALALAAPHLPADWELVCVGRDDGIGASLRERARAAGLAENCRWAGQVEDVDVYLQAADVSVLASHGEGFSNALLESMAAGLPVVATAVGGNSDAISDGVDGLLVPPRAPRALGDALSRLAEAPGLRARLGERARARVTDAFSEERCVDLYAQLYDNIIARRRLVIPPAARPRADGEPSTETCVD